MIRALLHFFGWCSHSHLYRERRKLHGLQVMHWICEDCGHAEPAIGRTAKEHRKAIRVGAVATPKARRITRENLEPMRKTGTR